MALHLWTRICMLHTHMHVTSAVFKSQRAENLLCTQHQFNKRKKYQKKLKVKEGRCCFYSFSPQQTNTEANVFNASRKPNSASDFLWIGLPGRAAHFCLFLPPFCQPPFPLIVEDVPQPTAGCCRHVWIRQIVPELAALPTLAHCNRSRNRVFALACLNANVKQDAEAHCSILKRT